MEFDDPPRKALHEAVARGPACEFSAHTLPAALIQTDAGGDHA